MTALGNATDWVGVCIVRVERQADQLLITVSSTPDITKNATFRQIFRHREPALAAVAEFVRTLLG